MLAPLTGLWWSSDQTLDFNVTMETHSVDLSMDLAALATLTADTGRAIVAGIPSQVELI